MGRVIPPRYCLPFMRNAIFFFLLLAACTARADFFNPSGYDNGDDLHVVTLSLSGTAVAPVPSDLTDDGSGYWQSQTSIISELHVMRRDVYFERRLMCVFFGAWIGITLVREALRYAR